MNTPDTEKFDVIGWLRNKYGLDDDDCLSAGRVQELCESLVYDVQASRDTYWKERVGNEQRKHNCPPDDGNDYDHGAWEACESILDNLK